MGKREGAQGTAWDSAAARHRPAAAWPQCARAARRGTSRGRPNRGGAEGLTGGHGHSAGRRHWLTGWLEQHSARGLTRFKNWNPNSNEVKQFQI
jgi:hypothetical protein